MIPEKIMKNTRMKVGDTVTERLMFDKGRSTSLYTGTVIYVHPEGRFYRAEFELPGGKVRESFSLYGTERRKK